MNRCCEDFELYNITADQFKSLIFICGPRSSKDADVRSRLLPKLEAITEGECTLQSLITEYRLQNFKHDTAMVEQRKSVSSICAVKQTNRFYGEADNEFRWSDNSLLAMWRNALRPELHLHEACLPGLQANRPQGRLLWLPSTAFSASTR